MNETTPNRKIFDLLSERDPWVERMSAEPADDLTIETIQELRRQLYEKPEETLLDAPAFLGSTPTMEEAHRLLDEAEAALRAPEATAAVLEAASNEFEEMELPVELQFPGYDPVKIPITPFARKFETIADAPAWGLTAVRAWVWRRTHVKPQFPRHSNVHPFSYPLEKRNNRLTVALFSDAANGYYHAQYIMKHVAMAESSATIHLGDVYYTGRDFEVSRYLEAPLKDVIATTPFFAMNANHEMDSHGIPYFDFLRRKRQQSAMQLQEGSYFCLVADRYQVIGLDTAFFANGRHNDAKCQAWLAEHLREGRDANKINILLTQNEPYDIGDATPAKLLDPDLRDVQEQIDIWFWGDEHFCALYGRSAQIPFIGSCIGHAGYPFKRLSAGGAATPLAPTLWEETGPRFPKELDWRDDVGNNGWCLLDLGDDALTLTYNDWRLQPRHVHTFPVQNGRLGG